MFRKVNPIVTLCTVICFLYIFLAVKPLSKETHFLTKWTVNSSRPSAEKPENTDHLIPFKMGQTAGYFTEDGKILSVFTFPYKAAVSTDDYALYGTNDSSIKIYFPDGTKKSSINIQGFPFFQDNRKYLMLPGGNSFVSLNDDGSKRWSYENYSPITSFSTSEAGVAAGYADGTVTVFDNDGEIQSQFTPGGSEYPVILGTAISADGSMTACISGQKKQRFVLARKQNNLTTIIYHEYFNQDTNRQLLIKFNKDMSRCYFSHKDCIGILNCKTLKTTHVPVKGIPLSIQETESEKAVFILSKDNNRYYVTLIENYDKASGNFSFTAESAFIAVRNDSLFVGRDSTISRIDIVHK